LSFTLALTILNYLFLDKVKFLYEKLYTFKYQVHVSADNIINVFCNRVICTKNL